MTSPYSSNASVNGRTTTSSSPAARSVVSDWFSGSTSDSKSSAPRSVQRRPGVWMTSGRSAVSSAESAFRRVSRSHSGSSRASAMLRTVSSERLSIAFVLMLSERALHFEFDEPVQLDRVLDGQLFRDGLDEARNDHLLGVVVVQPARLQVEDVLVADLPDRRLVGDVDLRLVDLHVRHRVRRRLVVEHQRVALDGRRRVLRAVRDVNEAAVVRPAAVLRDRLRLDGRLRVRRVVVHLRTRVDVLPLAREGDGDVVVGGAAALQD